MSEPDERTAGVAPEEGPRRPTCRCGFDRDHLMVSAVPRYSGWGGFWVIFMGVSATPKRIDFQCRVCQETFDQTVDPAALANSM